LLFTEQDSGVRTPLVPKAKPGRQKSKAGHGKGRDAFNSTEFRPTSQTLLAMYRRAFQRKPSLGHAPTEQRLLWQGQICALHPFARKHVPNESKFPTRFLKEIPNFAFKVSSFS